MNISFLLLFIDQWSHECFLCRFRERAKRNSDYSKSELMYFIVVYQSRESESESESMQKAHQSTFHTKQKSRIHFFCQLLKFYSKIGFYQF